MKKRILIAPLNWGLGHATRCIPIINALITFGFEPVIASDGIALTLLKKEFPNLEFVTLPSYNITYPKNGAFRWHFIKRFPRISKSINEENHFVQSLVATNNIHGIISDNRFGVYSNRVPSVYLTHQLNVLSGSTTKLSSKWHQKQIDNFDECWIPDNENLGLSGELGDNSKARVKTKYIGPLSRFEKQQTEKLYDLLVLLSGPEPQRTILEHKLLSELKSYDRKILFVKGIVEQEQTKSVHDNVTFYNFMTTKELEGAINDSFLVLARSGYSTIMDLAKLEKKAFFIPTPGQYEQEYLANHLQKVQIAPFCNQNDFSLNKLEEVDYYSGFNNTSFSSLDKALFGLF